MRFSHAVLLALCWAAPAHAENLVDVYRHAQQHDAVWATAEANYRALIEQLPQARAGLLPNAGLTANVTENRQQTKSPSIDSSTRFRSEGYGVELAQPLFDRPASAIYQQARATAAQAEYELASARQDLILRVAQAYFNVLAAQDLYEFAQSEKAAIRRLLELGRRNFNVGTSTLIDVHEAQAAYDLAVAEEITAANDLKVQREALTVLTGAAPTQVAPLSAKLDLDRLPIGDAEHWVQAAAKSNFRVRALTYALARAEQEIERSRGTRYPTVDVFVARNYSDSQNAILGTPFESTTDQVGVRLEMPLYQGGVVSSRIREAAARRDEAAAQLRLAERQLTQQTREAYLTMVSGAARVKALERARASNQKALESTILGSERGLRTGLDVLINQRTLYRALRDLAQARYAYLINQLRLEAVAGALDQTDLEQINRLLVY